MNGWIARWRRVLSGLLLLVCFVATPLAAADDDHMLSTLFRNHAAVMLFVDPASGEIIDANSAAAAFYGRSVIELRGMRIQDFNRLGADEVALERARAAEEARNYFIFPHRVAGGEIRTVEVYSSPIRLPSGRLALHSIVHDVTGRAVDEAALATYRARLEELADRRTREALEAGRQLRMVLIIGLFGQALIIAALVANLVRRRQTQRALAQREEQLSTLINAMPDIVCFKDGEGRWQEANDYMRRLLKLEDHEYRGKTDAELAAVRPMFASAFADAHQSDEHVWSTGATVREERAIPGADGAAHTFDIIKVPIFEQTGARRGVVVIGRDVTARKVAESQVEQLAYFDPLTRLPNRRLMLDRLGAALAAARRGERFGAVLFIDLDQFKTFNDARGHEAGDRLLAAAAERLSAALREADTVARFGGDEFVVLLPELSEREQWAADAARNVAEKVRQRLATAHRWEDEEVLLSASIGVTLFPTAEAVSVDDVLKQADTAMYQAKAAGRNQVRFFEPEMQARVEARFALEADLRHAVGRGELRLYLQPQVDARGRVVGAEALLRWEHPVRGLVPPNGFIPVAEETGLIVELGDWVLTRACRLLTRPAVAEQGLRIAVNVSPRQFHRVDFVERVRTILAETGADPTRLTLEVTEGLVIDDVHQTIATMSELRALGVHFSIDDFGTGYSSLAYLKRLPINEVKIDRTFVQDAPTDPNDAVLVEVILALARHLGLAVVAEGVETEAQADFLRARAEITCQGFLFGRPEPAEALLARLGACVRA